MRSALCLAIISLALAPFCRAVGVNDWSQPCFNHTCTYYLPEDGSGSGTLRLWGPPGKLSDITPAAGWEILDCDKDKLEQEIRIVCMDDAGCEHLHSHGGPEGKIVRLPESCGRMAFALIKRSWVHEDQSIPHHVARRLPKRQVAPVVLGKRITNEVAAESTKDIKFEAIGTTTKTHKGAYKLSDGKKGHAVIHTPSQQKGIVFVKNMLAPRPGSFVAKGAHRPRNILTTVGTALSDAVLGSVGYFSRVLFSLNEKNLEKTIPVEFHIPETTIASVLVNCETSQTSTTLSAHADGNMAAMVGIHMRGALGGNMDHAEAYVQMKGKIVGGIKLDANLDGHFGPFEASVFEHALNMIHFGWIFSVAPKLDMVGVVEGDLNLKGQMNYGFEYNVENLRLSFPSNQGKSDFQPKTAESPLKLKVDQTMDVSGKFVTHVITRLSVEFGLPGNHHASMFVAADVGVATSFGSDALLRPTFGSKANTKPGDVRPSDGNLEPGMTPGVKGDSNSTDSKSVNKDADPESKLVNGEAGDVVEKAGGSKLPESRISSASDANKSELNEKGTGAKADSDEDAGNVDSVGQGIGVKAPTSEGTPKDHKEVFSPGSIKSQAAPASVDATSLDSTQPHSKLSGVSNNAKVSENSDEPVQRRSSVSHSASPDAFHLHHHHRSLHKRLIKAHSRPRANDEESASSGGTDKPLLAAPSTKAASLLKAVPNLETTFGLLTNEMDGNACFFAQPSLRIFAGVQADTWVSSMIERLGFDGVESDTMKIKELYTVQMKPLNVLAGDARCPSVALPSVVVSKRAFELGSSGRASRRQSKRSPAGVELFSRAAAASCAVTVDSTQTGVGRAVNYMLAKEQTGVVVDPQIEAGNNLDPGSLPEVQEELVLDSQQPSGQAY